MKDKEYKGDMILPKGKLDSQLLKDVVFKNIKYKRQDVLVRASIGEDCAVLDYGEYECVVSTDPISAAIRDIGRLAINISCNDIASNGVEPIAITIALMLPPGTTLSEVETIMEDASKTASNLGVEIIGGHTEITGAVNQPVIVSTALGKGPEGGSQKAVNMVPGSVVLMTKKAGIEGTGIICADCRDKLKGVLTEEEIVRGVKFLDETSVVKEGIAAGKVGTLGMHDVTEGGVLGAIWEMCQISDLGAIIYGEKINIDPITLKICAYFDIDYLRLISSGSMVIVASPERAEYIIEAVEEEGVEISKIGEILTSDMGIKIKTSKGLENIDPPAGDHLYKVL